MCCDKPLWTRMESLDRDPCQRTRSFTNQLCSMFDSLISMGRILKAAGLIARQAGPQQSAQLLRHLMVVHEPPNCEWI